jgi:hypothetical protein
MSGLIDLEELVLKCRDEKARVYIAEAVGCYKGTRSFVLVNQNVPFFSSVFLFLG